MNELRLLADAPAEDEASEALEALRAELPSNKGFGPLPLLPLLQLFCIASPPRSPSGVTNGGGDGGRRIVPGPARMLHRGGVNGSSTGLPGLRGPCPDPVDANNLPLAPATDSLMVANRSGPW